MELTKNNRQDNPVRIKLSELPDLECPECRKQGIEKQIHFIPAMRLKWVAPFLDGNPKPGVQPVDVIVCLKCSHEITVEDIEKFVPQKNTDGKN